MRDCCRSRKGFGLEERCGINDTTTILYGEYQPYTLLAMDRLTIYSARGAYLYRGYPSDLREVDFESKRVEQGAVTSRAEYAGRTPYATIRGSITSGKVFLIEHSGIIDVLT